MGARAHSIALTVVSVATFKLGAISKRDFTKVLAQIIVFVLRIFFNRTIIIGLV
jgi:hypothetical protein